MNGLGTPTTTSAPYLCLRCDWREGCKPGLGSSHCWHRLKTWRGQPNQLTPGRIPGHLQLVSIPVLLVKFQIMFVKSPMKLPVFGQIQSSSWTNHNRSAHFSVESQMLPVKLLNLHVCWWNSAVLLLISQFLAKFPIPVESSPPATSLSTGKIRGYPRYHRCRRAFSQGISSVGGGSSVLRSHFLGMSPGRMGNVAPNYRNFDQENGA